MSTLIALFITLLTAVPMLGQTVANGGFDLALPTDLSRPANWRVKEVAGYVISLDSAAPTDPADPALAAAKAWAAGK